MTITAGDTLPQGQLLRVGEAGPETVDTADLMQGKVALFGQPHGKAAPCGITGDSRAVDPAADDEQVRRLRHGCLTPP